MGDVNASDFNVTIRRGCDQGEGNRLIEAPRAAAAGVEQDCFPLPNLLIPMAVTEDHQIIGRKIGGQVAFLMRHEDAQPVKREIQIQRYVLGPILIVVAAHDIYRGDGLQREQNSPVVDVAAVENGVGVGELIERLLPQQAMRIRQNTDFHREPSILRYRASTASVSHTPFSER